MIKRSSAEIWMISLWSHFKCALDRGKDRTKKAMYTVFKMLLRRTVHKEPRLLKFSTQISLFKQLSYGKILF